MKKSEIKMLEALCAQEGIKGKKLIKGVLWLNTVKPKYKEGDKVKVTHRGMRICGERVIEWNAVVTKVNYFWADKLVTYQTEVTYTLDGVEEKTMVCALETDLKRSRSSNSGKRFKRSGKDFIKECLEVYI